MRNHRLVQLGAIAAVAFIVAIAGRPAPVNAQSNSASERITRHSRSQHNDRNFVRADRLDNIVCLKGGCRPLPPHCHAVTEIDRTGGPTGYQLIACP